MFWKDWWQIESVRGRCHGKSWMDMGVKQDPKKMTSKVEAGLEDTFPIRKAVCTLDYNLGLVEDHPKACNWPVSVLGRNWSSVLTPKLKTYLNANAFVSFCFCCLHFKSQSSFLDFLGLGSSLSGSYLQQ